MPVDLSAMLWKTRLPPSVKSARLLEALHREKVTVVVLTRPIGQGPYGVLADRFGPPVAGPEPFDVITPNPFRRRGVYSVIAVRLPPEADGSCPANH